MAIDRPQRAGVQRAARQVGPAGFDLREQQLADAIHHHVMLRDACLSPSAQIADKLDRLREPSPIGADDVGGLAGRVSIVAQMSGIRRHMADTGALLACERRRLVLLDVLAALPHAPEDGMPWARNPVDLVGEAAAGIGYSVADVRRLARTLDVSRAGLPPVEIGPSTTRTFAESLRGVLQLTPGAAVANAILLLLDRVPEAWTPSACGAVLLDPGPRVLCRFMGTLVARHDLAAFGDDLATLRVAADLSPTVRRYASVLLPQLAEDLSTVAAPAAEHEVLTLAADLAGRTAELLPRGFRRFDRAPRTTRFVIAD
ncbi:hypothetical protein [Mobilicoccus massiliensis]|uniref:hypothetical protein n=1 Tax=Mobilicoccus massiliensis TaxID=1522310 RepID=UPI00058CFDE5|nr:hypothetical protein [Mobilicoccus massiliensis]